MSKGPPPAAPWGAVALLVVILVILVWSWHMFSQRRAECASRNGTLIVSRSNTQCIKDGKIIIIWDLGTRIDNP